MITYTSKTTSIEFSIPQSWDIRALSGLTLQIADREGNELQAATAASIYTPTELNTAAAQFDDTLYLKPAAGNLAIGDMIGIEGYNGFEVHTVKGFDSTSKIVLLEEVLGRAYESGADVYRMSAVATVNFTNTTTYPPGIQLILTWTPTGTGSVITELAEIESTSQVDVAAFEKEFRALYPRAYNALTVPADRFGIIIRMAQDRLRLQLATRGLDVARIKDQRLLSPPLMSLVAKMWALDGDDDLIEERKVLSAEYNSVFEEFCSLPIWVDFDNDNIQDDDEVQNYPVYFERTW